MPWTFLKVFANPNVIIAVIISAILGLAYYKYHSLQSDLAEATIALKQEKDNNVVLRDNIDTMTQVNAANDKILQQQIIAATTTVETITQLSDALKKKNQSFNGTQSRIDSIKDTPVPLTSYLKEAINGIQAERDTNTPTVLANNEITEITSTQEGGIETVRVVLTTPLSVVPSGFILQSPSRVVIDLLGATNSIGRNTIPSTTVGNLQSITVVKNSDRSRLVLNLQKTATYTAKLQNNILLLILDAPK